MLKIMLPALVLATLLFPITGMAADAVNKICGEDDATALALSLHVAMYKQEGHFLRVDGEQTDVAHAGQPGVSRWYVGLADGTFEFDLKSDGYSCSLVANTLIAKRDSLRKREQEDEDSQATPCSGSAQ